MKGITFKIIGAALLIICFIGGLVLCISLSSFLLFLGIMVGAFLEAMPFFGIGAILDKLDSIEQDGNCTVYSKSLAGTRMRNFSTDVQPITANNSMMKHVSGLELEAGDTVKVYVSEERIAFVKGSFTKIIKVEDVISVASGLKKFIEDVPGFDKSTLNDSWFYFIIKYKTDNGDGYVILDVNGNGIVADTFKEEFNSSKT